MARNYPHLDPISGCDFILQPAPELAAEACPECGLMNHVTFEVNDGPRRWHKCEGCGHQLNIFAMDPASLATAA